MSTTSAVELDFFGIQKEISAKSKAQNLFDRRRSFRDIQTVISKINPEILKSIIATGTVNTNSMGLMASNKSYSLPSTPKMECGNIVSPLPVYTPTLIRPNTTISESTQATAPLTIFYNGTVAVFDIPHHKAENILKLAHEGGIKKAAADSKLAVSSNHQQQLLETLNGDLPIARTKSLQRFLEKRKERLTLVSPYAYGCPTDYAFPCQKTSARIEEEKEGSIRTGGDNIYVHF